MPRIQQLKLASPPTPTPHHTTRTASPFLEWPLKDIEARTSVHFEREILVLHMLYGCLLLVTLSNSFVVVLISLNKRVISMLHPMGTIF